MEFERYKQNLRVEHPYVLSYNTKVAMIEGGSLIKLPWRVDGKTSSPTTSKHINYVAEELGLVVTGYSHGHFKNMQINLISDILNEAKVFDKISDALHLRLNSDDEFFWDIEEIILENFKRMDFEHWEEAEG